jgi:glyoxylase-like metal-dependent hydrolase (beta-lactamase superfamily II)
MPHRVGLRFHGTRAVAWACMTISGGWAGAAGQRAPMTVAESYARARALLDSTVDLHGGVDALRGARRFTVSMRGYDYWRNQSRRVEPPYDSEPYAGDLRVDLSKGRLVWTVSSTYPGGFHNAGRMVIDGSHAFYVNYRQHVFVNIPGRTIDGQRDALTRLPHVLLLAALDNAAGLRWLGPMRLTNGVEVQGIAASTPTGPLTLGIDPRSKELRAVLDVQADPVVGDAPVEVEFPRYQRIGGLLVPSRRVVRVGGEVTQDVVYSVTEGGVDQPIADSLLAPPPGLSEFPLAAASDTVRQLAPSAWAIRSAGYWSLAVAFADYVLVVEAPASGVAWTMTQIASLAPGKPVRYVTATHFHEDHAGGMRYYMAAGATVVTTPGNRRYFERMARAYSTLQPTGPKELPRPVQIETITGGARIFTDGTQTVELHDIGPTPHANEMLVAWLPADGILFQGDLLNLPPNSAILPGGSIETMSYFASWVKRQGWSVRVLAGVHMTPGSMTELDAALDAAKRP